MTCMVEGCDQPDTMDIVLHAADGDGAWRACWEHTLEFEQWCREEVDKQGGDLAEAFMWTRR